MSMTMLGSDPVLRDDAPTAGSAIWTEVEKGFWVGNTPGRFLGTVERGPEGFIARDDSGVGVGSYSSLAEARAAVGHLRSEPRS